MLGAVKGLGRIVASQDLAGGGKGGAWSRGWSWELDGDWGWGWKEEWSWDLRWSWSWGLEADWIWSWSWERT